MWSAKIWKNFHPWTRQKQNWGSLKMSYCHLSSAWSCWVGSERPRLRGAKLIGGNQTLILIGCKISENCSKLHNAIYFLLRTTDKTYWKRNFVVHASVRFCSKLEVQWDEKLSCKSTRFLKKATESPVPNTQEDLPLTILNAYRTKEKIHARMSLSDEEIVSNILFELQDSNSRSSSLYQKPIISTKSL